MPVPKLLVTTGLLAFNYGLSQTRKIEGPRLDDLKFSGGNPGAPWTRGWGTFRTFGLCLWARDLTEVKRRRKTKGGKYNEYTYYADMAWGIAGHEVDAITRIWLDKHLVYDVTGSGPITPFDFGGTGNLDEFLAIYLGTSTQAVDPYMETFVDAEFGAGSTPAYRNKAYAVFKNLPVEKFGNRFPVPEFEVVNNATTIYPRTDLDAPDIEDPQAWSLNDAHWNQDYSLIYLWNTTPAPGPQEPWMTIVDPLTHTVVDNYKLDYAATNNLVIDNQGGLYTATTGGIRYWPPSYGTSTVFKSFASSCVNLWAQYGDDGIFYMLARLSTTDMWWYDGVSWQDVTDTTGIVGIDFDINRMFKDREGSIWWIGDDGSNIYFYRIVPGYLATSAGVLTVTGITPGSQIEGHHYKYGDYDQFVIYNSGGLHAIDKDDGTVLASNTSTTNLDALSLINLVPGSHSLWNTNGSLFEEYSLADLTKLSSITASTWSTPDSTPTHAWYDPLNHAILTDNDLSVLSWCYLDRISGSGVTLETIENDIAPLCGVDTYDFSAHTQVVEGWSITQGQASNALEPLHDIYDCTIRPHDFTIQGINFSGSSGGTIEASEFVKSEPRYTVTLHSPIELPRRVTVNYADPAIDQQQNNVVSQIRADETDAAGDVSIDLTTWVSDAETARDYADRRFRRIWNEARQPKADLTTQQLGLEPGDCMTLDLDGESATYRLNRMVIRADDTIATEWKYDHASLAVVGTLDGAGLDGRTNDTIQVPSLAKGFVLDIPYTQDLDQTTNPIVYHLAGPYGGGYYTGSTLYEQDATDPTIYADEIDSISSSMTATWGFTNGAFASTNHNLWDRLTQLVVFLNSGTLSSSTEAAIDADDTINLAAVGTHENGWELINFSTATLNADGSYTLTGLKRGRRGSEQFRSTHTERDLFVLVDDGDYNIVELPVSDLTADLSYKEISEGRGESGAQVIDLTFAANSLKPYAPTNCFAYKETNGDWTIYFTRRTRIGGAWTGGRTIPVSEDSESYELDLGDGVTTVTKTASSSPYTWTVATQTTDTGAEVTRGNLTFDIYQMSADVGRGWGTAGTA